VAVPREPGDYLLATGKDHRDWATLAAACKGLNLPVLVAGPDSLPHNETLQLARPASRDAYFELVSGARAVVIPLVSEERPAGQLALLDAFSVGRAVVATRGRGTDDYVTSQRGRLVSAGDADELRAAIIEVSELSNARRMGMAALESTRKELDLARFLAEVANVARQASQDRMK
jgi:glycosyltransferase involved in cell wall biosynthesis